MSPQASLLPALTILLSVVAAVALLLCVVAAPIATRGRELTANGEALVAPRGTGYGDDVSRAAAGPVKAAPRPQTLPGVPMPSGRQRQPAMAPSVG